jgi:isopenicillin-N epimerase
VLDVARLVAALDRRGGDTLIDGAHAPGMLPLDLGRLGAAYYTGNCHKWLCAPKGVGFLHVRPDRRARIRPPVTSHGRNAPAQARSRFHLELDWTGTFDPSAALSVPTAIETMAATHPQGWPGRMAANHALAVRARQLLCDALGFAPACPESMLGSMAAIPLPPGDAFALYAALMDGRDGPAAEVPVAPWPAPPAQILRVSAQAYNAEADYRLLATTLQRALAAGS